MPVNYHPLRKEQKEIRVIELLSAHDEAAPLRSTLKHVSLANANYEALSCVWGDQNDLEQLEIKYEYTAPLSGAQSVTTSLFPMAKILSRPYFTLGTTARRFASGLTQYAYIRIDSALNPAEN